MVIVCPFCKQKLNGINKIYECYYCIISGYSQTIHTYQLCSRIKVYTGWIDDDNPEIIMSVHLYHKSIIYVSIGYYDNGTTIHPDVILYDLYKGKFINSNLPFFDILSMNEEQITNKINTYLVWS
jgi:hypothetical protein